MSVKIELNFDKPTISMGMIDILKNGLVEDPEQTLSKLTLVECITVLTKGKKLQVAPANYLLSKLMRMLSIEDSAIEDEIPLSGTHDLGKDLSMSQIMGEVGSKDSLQDLDNTQKSEVIKSDETAQTNSKKRSEVCRFYTNGKCKFNNECRFMHPKICPKLRQHGDCKTKGCNGDCEFLHPNVCRNSFKDRTCSYNDCRFFHLKGTKTVEREYNKANNTNAASNPNWRNKSQSKTNN